MGEGWAFHYGVWGKEESAQDCLGAEDAMPLGGLDRGDDSPGHHRHTGPGSSQYINSQNVVMEAKDHGYAEGIALDQQGFVSEGSGENIFLVYKGRIHTPPLASSILNGITRDCALTIARSQGYEIVEEQITREMLYLADEIFFSGTAAEITPVTNIDRIPVGDGNRGAVTKGIQAEFFGIVEDGAEDKFGWLTPVPLG